jgi:hypothetical protein
MNQRQNRVILTLVCLVVGTPGVAQESIHIPFLLPIPDGWRTETIPFPLEFAPELAYEGLEELRFAPGMFIEDSDDFWSYAFVWWVPGDTEFDSGRVAKDLEAYFRGLTDSVAEAREFDPGQPEFEVRLAPVESNTAEPVQWEGTIRTFDAFTTRKLVRLRVRVVVFHCHDQDHLAALFQLSPQPSTHKIWDVMDDMRRKFRCQR